MNFYDEIMCVGKPKDYKILKGINLKLKSHSDIHWRIVFCCFRENKFEASPSYLKDYNLYIKKLLKLY